MNKNAIGLPSLYTNHINSSLTAALTFSSLALKSSALIGVKFSWNTQDCDMKLFEVNDKKTKKEFLDVARVLYKDDDVWVCPPDKTIDGIFDPDKNVFFNHGEACRWILKDDQGMLIGRVAAFINNKKAFNFDPPTAGMGFFECINDNDAAFMLFDKCKEWLSERKIEAMDGPINFGENDNFWGLLVEGFTHPSYGMNYNFPYYKDLFEAYGFIRRAKPYIIVLV